MFERFTDRARRIVILAQEEAKMLNHHYIGTEHLLLGLIHEGDGVAARALLELGIGLDGVRAQVEGIIGRGEQPPTGHIPFTPRAKKVLELSLREALQLGHNYIGTEHILLGLVREGEGIAAQVLVRLGADLSRVRYQVLALLESENPGTPLEERPWPVITASGTRPFRYESAVIMIRDAQPGDAMLKAAIVETFDPEEARTDELRERMADYDRRLQSLAEEGRQIRALNDQA